MNDNGGQTMRATYPPHVETVAVRVLDARRGYEIDWIHLVRLIQGPYGEALSKLRASRRGPCTLLHKAIDARRPDYCALLLARGADVEALDGLRATPLIRCSTCMRGEADLEIATLLIRHGALVDGEDPMRRTALHHAAAIGNAPLVDLLARNGANVNRMGGLHRTALHAAAVSGHFAAVKALVVHGADVSIRDELNGMTAADAARKFRRWDVADWLTTVQRQSTATSPRDEEPMSMSD